MSLEPTSEPTRLVGAIQAALSATIGLLVLVDVVPKDVGGALSIALGAWIVVGHELLRSKVTPVEAATLTAAQAAKVEIKG